MTLNVHICMLIFHSKKNEKEGQKSLEYVEKAPNDLKPHSVTFHSIK